MSNRVSSCEEERRLLLGTCRTSLLLGGPSLGSQSPTRFLSSHQGHLLDKQPPPGTPGVPLETPHPSQAGAAAAPRLVALSFFWRMYRTSPGRSPPFSPGCTEHPECTGRQNNHGRVLRRDCLSLEGRKEHLHIFDCTRVFCYCLCF